MRATKLAFQSQQKMGDQLTKVAVSTTPLSQNPIPISADTLLLNDYARREVDCSGGNVTLTLKDATQVGDWTWIIHRSDSSGNTLTIEPEIPAQLINGLASWPINPGETFEFHSEQNQYSVK